MKQNAPAPPATSRAVLNAREAAAFLNISERHLRGLKDVPRLRLGRRCVFPEDALRTYIVRNTETA
jgi:hypothetical protein